MDNIKIVFKGEFTDLNTYIKAINGSKFSGNNIKQEETDRVYYECLKQKIKPTEEYPVHIVYNWYSKDKRKDIDNICFSKKYINDGMVIAKVIKDDSQKYVTSIEDNFFVDKNNPRVEVLITKKNN